MYRGVVEASCDGRFTAKFYSLIHFNTLISLNEKYNSLRSHDTLEILISSTRVSLIRSTELDDRARREARDARETYLGAPRLSRD